MQKQKNFILNFILGMVIFLAIDIIWIYGLAKPIYIRILGHFLRDDILQSKLYVGSTLGVYALLVLGLLIYVLPKSHTFSYAKSFGFGALFGLIVYGVFALTNYTLLNIWSYELVLVDMIWGAIISGLLTIILKRFSFR